MATGRVERGTIKMGEPVDIVGLEDERSPPSLPVWKCSPSCWTSLKLATTVGVLLRGIARADIERGQVLCKPGSIHPHTKFKGQVYVLKKDEGGSHPFFSNYRPQFYFRTTDAYRHHLPARGR